MIGLKQRQTFRAAHAAGMKMLFGTDAGVYPHGTNARQFARMVEWGMTPMEAIQAATRSAAEALDRTADVGAIAPGRYADLIAVDGDPLKGHPRARDGRDHHEGRSDRQRRPALRSGSKPGVRI